MLTSIIILNWNTLKFLKMCVASIKDHTKDYELIIVDNGSKENGTKEYIESVTDKYIFNPYNFGYAKANNLGYGLVEGELICFLNSDTIVTKDWLENMKKTMKKHPKCAIVGSVGNQKTRYVSGMAWHYQQYIGQYKEETKVGFVSGYCMLIKKDIFEEVGKWDEEFPIGTYEDNFLCEKTKKLGYELWINPNAIVKHYGSASFKLNGIDYEDLIYENRGIFFKKMKKLHGIKR